MIKKLILAALFVLSACPAFAANPNEIVRIAVMPFDSSTPYASAQDVASATDIFTDVMVKSRTISVIERRRIEDVFREQRMSLSGLIDPSSAVRLGRLLNCQYLIQGSVTNLSMGNTESNRYETSTTHKLKGSATIHARLTDTTTGEVVWSDSMTQDIEQSTTEYHDKGHSSTSRPSESIVRQQAITMATRHLANKIREQIVGENAQVISVGKKEIRINKGSLLGVNIGDLYLVYGEGEAIRDIDGSILDREKLNVAVIQITKTFDNYSEAIIFGTESKSTGGLLDIALVPIAFAGSLLGVDQKPAGSIKFIHVGDRLRYVTPDETQDLIKKKAFASKRPKETPKSKYSPKVQEAIDHINNNNNQAGSSFSSASASSPVSSSTLENYSTDPDKVIPTYGLPKGESNARITLHKNLLREVKRNPKSQNAYKRYVEMAQSYNGDYLAAYQAGLIAKAQGNTNYALYWFKNSLNANPNFEPAKTARDNLNSSPAPAKKKPARKRR